MYQSLQSNIWKYTLFLITNKRIFVAILGAYYLIIPGVTPKGIGIILLAGSLSGFLLEIPSGYVSDKMGHKKALVFSRILCLFSTVLFLVANNIIVLILAAIFMSAGIAFQSGTGSAFMHETLKGLGREHEYTKIMGKASSLGFAIPIVLMTLTPFFVSVSYKLPFMIALVIDCVGLAVAFSLIVPHVPQEHIEEISNTNFRQVMAEGKRLGFLPYAFLAGLISGALFTVGGFRAPYQAVLQIPVIYFGIFFGAGRALASLMLAYSDKIKTLFTHNTFYGLKILLFAVLIIVLGLVETRWVVVALFVVINAFHWGLSQVSTSYSMDMIKSSKFKATLLSIKAQLGELIGAIAGFGVGQLIQDKSYQFGFLTLGIVFFIIASLLYFFILKKDTHKVAS